MSDREKPTQRTEKGHEIPVPTRKEWERSLEKIIKPRPGESDSDAPSQPDKR